MDRRKLNMNFPLNFLYKKRVNQEEGYPSEEIQLTYLELIFNMLGEASTTEIAVEREAQGFVENQKAARE